MKGVLTRSGQRQLAIPALEMKPDDEWAHEDCYQGHKCYWQRKIEVEDDKGKPQVDRPICPACSLVGWPGSSRCFAVGFSIGVINV
jgi:hypothetical protein